MNIVKLYQLSIISLKWRHNGRDGVSNHQPRHCLLNHSFRPRSKKTSKLRVTGLCAGNSPVTSEFPTQMASNTKNVSIWWRHHVQWSEPQQCQWLPDGSPLSCDVLLIPELLIYTARKKQQIRWGNTKVLTGYLSISYMLCSTHWGQVTHICVSKLGHHWFR